MRPPVHIVGGGLAGSEAAWTLARLSVPCVLHEMRPESRTPAHQTGQLAELVCSNSFRSDEPTHPVGALHQELRAAGSLILSVADQTRVPAGSALAMDREHFAAGVTRAIAAHPGIELRRGIVGTIPDDWESTIIATGPLTHPDLAGWLARQTGQDHLAFFDAIAPIVHTDSIDFSIVWRQSRWDKGQDYLNCPMDRAQYEAFVGALLEGDVTEFHDWERDTPYFDACLPIEVMAARGLDTLRFGPMKPVGLRSPHGAGRPHAVVQLRQDNQAGTLYNMVGFQTKLRHAGQVRLFRTIPGLENAEFARLGGIHRNMFVCSPAVLDSRLRLMGAGTPPGQAGEGSRVIRLAGQLTGVEGYVESTAIGLLAGLFAAGEWLGVPIGAPPPETALGALLTHLTSGADPACFQPMNINFGLFPPAPDEGRGRSSRKLRRLHLIERAQHAFLPWISSLPATIPCYDSLEAFPGKMAKGEEGVAEGNAPGPD